MDLQEPDAAAVETFWAAYSARSGVAGPPEDVFGFGDSAEMADRLAQLILTGPKRATAGPRREYDELGLEARVGDHAVITGGDGLPLLVLRLTDVRHGPLSSVDDRFAWDEGEGDRTRDWWVQAHQRVFRRTFAAAGWPADDDPDLVFSRFVVVWPPEAADPSDPVAG